MKYSPKEFKLACTQYLSSLSIATLRAYGRHIGVSQATERKKENLMNQIISVLVGESMPSKRTTRGAPVKDGFVDPKILEKIEQLKREFLTKPQDEGIRFGKKKGFGIEVHSHEFYRGEGYDFEMVYKGRLETLEEVPCLVAEDGDWKKDKIFVTVEQIHAHDLREGDAVSCHIELRGGVVYAKDVLSVNGVAAITLERGRFEEEPVCYPTKKIPFGNKQPFAEAKYLNWLLPMGIGQRCLISAAPKAGKSTFLKKLASSLSVNGNYKIFALLIEQSPELVSEYKQFLPAKDVYATTFEEEAEKHVFLAEFVLKHAKRLAEMGEDVIVFVDSLTNLAKAYNETEYSEGGKRHACGLELNTIRYIKKYFGAARCFSKKGSLTILATASASTGDTADDVLQSELSSVANGEIRLNEALAIKRIFPAVDLSKSYTQQSMISASEDESSFCDGLQFRGKEQELFSAIASSKGFEEFFEKIKEF